MTDRLPPMTFSERCKLSTDSLPKAHYRLMLEVLHREMLVEIERLHDSLVASKERNT